MGEAWYSSSELAGLPGQPAYRTGVARKARNENWKHRNRQGRGGGLEYAFESLPPQTQAALLERATTAGSSLSHGVSCPPTDPDEAKDLAKSSEQPLSNSFHKTQPIKGKPKSTSGRGFGDRSEDKGDAWYEILKSFEFWCELNNSVRKLERDLAFVQAYSVRELTLPGWVYESIPSISRSTLLDKKKLVRAGQLTALGGQYGNRTGKGKIASNSALRKAIEECIAAGGKHWGPSHIYELLILEFGFEPEKDFTLGMLREWIRQFRKNNPQKWALYMDRSRARGTATPAFGSRSQGIVRPNQVWEIDSLKADIVLKYKCPLTGETKVRRYSLIICIDVYTRRAKILLSDLSKASAICLLIAEAILEWGVPEGIRTDNGKDYLSRRVKRFLRRLNINTDDLRCDPGHPEQKPFIERFNRTFQYRDLVKLPGFLGHSVSDQQALRSRPDWQEEIIELAMMPEDFSQWCNEWLKRYEQRPHGRPGIGLEGKSPLEVLAEAAEGGWQKRVIDDSSDNDHALRKLHFLMMEAPGKHGMRLVGRQGISVSGRLYVAPEFGGLIGRSFYVCLNPHDRTRVYVYDSANLKKFICEAVWRNAEGVNLAEIAAKAWKIFHAISQEVEKFYKRGQALARKIAKDPLSILGDVPDAREILPQIQSQLHEFPALQAITAAIAATEPRNEELQISPEEIQAELARLEIEQAKRLASEERSMADNTSLEEVLEHWRQGKAIDKISPDTLESCIRHLETPSGSGFLMGVSTSKQEEQRFRDWLTGKTIDRPVAIDHDALLKSMINAWRTDAVVSLTDIDNVLYDLSQPAGDGALIALLENSEERRQFKKWLQGKRLEMTDSSGDSNAVQQTQ